NFDGIEIVPSGILVASQVDSLLYIFDGQASLPVVRVPGAPADIGYDTQRNRVAVPCIALDRVDIWELRQPESPDDGGRRASCRPPTLRQVRNRDNESRTHVACILPAPPSFRRRQACSTS